MTQDELLAIMKETDLFLLVGNSRTGKTKIANIIAFKYKAEIISGDIINVKYPLNDAYGMSLNLNDDFLNLNKKVIIDNPNLTDKIRNPYLSKAFILGKRSLIIDCGNESDNDSELRKESYQKPTILYDNQKIIDKNEFLYLID